MKKLKLVQFYLKLVVVVIVSSTAYLYGNFNLVIGVLLLYLLDNMYILKRYWDESQKDLGFTKFIDSVIQEELYHIFMPIVLVKDDGEIIWYNGEFSKLKNDEKLNGLNIKSVIKGIGIDILLKEKKNNNQKLKINNSIYDIQCNVVNKGQDKYIVIYFNNINDLLTIDGVRENIMLIEIDNITEVLEGTEENNRPLVIAEIERTINTYGHNLNAMVKRYDNFKYILSVQDKYIEKEIEDKFPVVETVSKINKGNKIEITMSIGIGRGGISPLENSNFAILALELALGRGGDQIVIKNNDNVRFFGGNSKGVEKRTRVRARVVSHALKELILENEKVLIMGHNNPDMDCFGSAVALSSIIKQLGKECHIILNNDTKAIEHFLSKLKDDKMYDNRFISLSEAYQIFDENTLILILDVHNRGYVLDNELLQKTKKKVIIDHHRRSPDMITGSILSYIEVYASSTSEMITEIIQYIMDKPKLTKFEAEGLLAGIFMDTKGFYFKTGVRTFEAASFLKNIGADTIEVKKLFIDNLEDYLKIAETIKSAKVDTQKRVAVAVCPDRADTVIVAKSADELLNLSGISVSFVLGEVDDTIFISGRSMGDANVQVVLEALGGGGHMNMAGTKMHGISMDTAIEMLQDSIDKYLKVGE
jgi:c-di-AMP phosphodiesterase-like protein